MNKNKIIINSSVNNQKYVVVKSKNNQTLATTETYKTKQGAENAVKALQKVIKDAVVIDKSKPLPSKAKK